MNDEHFERIDDIPGDPGSLDGIDAIRFDCNDIEFTVQGDSGLFGAVRLAAERGASAPSLMRKDGELVIFQRGRYRGTPAVLSVPDRDCPPIAGSHDRGAMSFIEVNAGVSLEHGMGDLRFTGGRGSVDLACGRGAVVLDSRPGDVGVRSGSGDVRLVRGDGTIALSLGRGDISLDSCGGNLICKSGSGDVNVNDCFGSLTTKSGSGDVNIARPRDMWIVVSTGSGDVNIRGGSLIALRVRSGKGDIISTANLLLPHAEEFDFEEPDLPFDAGEPIEQSPDDPFGINDLLRSKGLEFVAGDKGVRISGGPFEFEASDEGVRFGKGSFSFVASDQGVRIFRGDDEKPGQFDIQTAKGDVAIDVPSGFPTRVEAIINSGDVRSDIPLVSVGRPGPRGTTQRFVGVSGPPNVMERLSLKLKTNRGDIRVRAVSQPGTLPSPPRPPRPAVPPDQAPTTRNNVAPGERRSREERMRSILDSLARGDLSVGDAERMLAELEREGNA